MRFENKYEMEEMAEALGISKCKKCGIVKHGKDCPYCGYKGSTKRSKKK